MKCRICGSEGYAFLYDDACGDCLVKERDEARAEVERLKADLALWVAFGVTISNSFAPPAIRERCEELMEAAKRISHSVQGQPNV